MVKPRAYPVHHMPGRTRLRVRARRGDRAFFADVGARLRRLPGVSRVDVNPTTGSLLIHHSIPIKQLVSAALGSDLGDLVDFVLSAPPVAQRLRAEVMQVDKGIRSYTGNELDLRTVAAIGLLAFAATQLLRGREAVSSVSLAWYAAELMTRWTDPSAQQSPS
jgi:hypothetical protein